MKNLKLLLIGLLLLLGSNLYAQYEPTIEDLLVDDVIIDFKPDTTSIPRGGAFDFYNNLRTWIPYCNSEPLKKSAHYLLHSLS